MSVSKRGHNRKYSDHSNDISNNPEVRSARFNTVSVERCDSTVVTDTVQHKGAATYGIPSPVASEVCYYHKNVEVARTEKLGCSKAPGLRAS